MVNDEVLQKISDMMQSNELIFLKGQIRNIQRRLSDQNVVYYVADLRVPRNTGSDDVYAVSFNTYHVCFSNDFVTQVGLTDEHMKHYKDNEVIVNCGAQANLNTNKQEDITYKFNNIKLFVNDIMLARSIEKPNFKERKVVSL